MTSERSLGIKPLNSKNCKVIVYADIDGTILNEQYEARAVEPFLKELLALSTSIVFNSSKTQAEIEYYRKKWSIHDPFIVENGSAVFIPKNYFKQPPKTDRQTDEYDIIELGMPYKTVRQKLAAAKTGGQTEVWGFGDMTIQEVSTDCGLPIKLAELAKIRNFSEPFKIQTSNTETTIEAIKAQGLRVTRGGRYFHAMGDTDKGKAAAKLNQIYASEFKVFSVGVGDGPNDLPLLKVVDEPFWVDQKNSKEKVWKKILATAKTHLAEV